MKRSTRNFIKYVSIVGVVLSVNYFYNKNIINETNNLKLEFSDKLIELSDEHQKQINQLKAGISQDNIRRWNILNTEKIIAQTNDQIPYSIRIEYAEWIVNETSKYGNVDVALILGLMKQESNFNHKAVSQVGARGLGQIMPMTAQDICEHLKISYIDGIEYDPKMNIKMTVWFMNRLIQNYKSMEVALAYYNGGYWQAYRYNLLSKKILTDKEEYQVNKLAMETEEYVPKVMKNYYKFNNILNTK